MPKTVLRPAHALDLETHCCASHKHFDKGQGYESHEDNYCSALLHVVKSHWTKIGLHGKGVEGCEQGDVGQETAKQTWPHSIAGSLPSVQNTPLSTY